jgi:hypothetical protein
MRSLLRRGAAALRRIAFRGSRAHQRVASWRVCVSAEVLARPIKKPALSASPAQPVLPLCVEYDGSSHAYHPVQEVSLGTQTAFEDKLALLTPRATDERLCKSRTGNTLSC